MLPSYAPIFRSFLNMNDYAIFLKEEEFIDHPIVALNNAIAISNYSLCRLLAGIHLVQRLIVPEHPKSLFVPAFVRETVASMKEDYYIMPKKISI